MFREVLQDAVRRTEGCLGALIMGTDGLTVEKVFQHGTAATGVDLEIAVAEFASLVNNARRASSALGLGKLQETTLSGESSIFILRFVSRDYFIAMILSPAGNFGRGRYELRLAELLLEKELAV